MLNRTALELSETPAQVPELAKAGTMELSETTAEASKAELAKTPA